MAKFIKELLLTSTLRPTIAPLSANASRSNDTILFRTLQQTMSVILSGCDVALCSKGS